MFIACSQEVSVTSSVLGIDMQTGHNVDVPQASRREGLYIIGIQGTGKTGLIENLIIQDIKQGVGVGLLDPHGDVTNAVLSRLPSEREKDVIYLDITDEDFPFGLNLFTCSNPNSAKAVQIVVDKVMHIFEKLFDLSPASTPRLRQYLRNCTYTLIANPGYTMADMPFLLLDEHCRKKLIANVVTPQVQGFWKTYNALKPSEKLDHADSTLNKLDELLQPLTVNIVGQSVSTIDFRKIMDERKILLVKLDAQLSSITSLIGSIIIALFLNAAYSRADLPVHKRRQFNLYADEFQRFSTEDFALLLTEARKFGIATTIAHQARYQPGMTDGIRATSLSAKNLVVFKVNSKDGDDLAGEFDVTPLEARVEVLEKERIETMEVTDGEEPLKVYERQVVDHLLKQGHVDKKGYEDERVMQFVKTYLQPVSLKYNEYVAKQQFAEINIWLYEGMVNPDNLFQVLPESIFELSLTSKYFRDFWSCLFTSSEKVKMKTEKMKEEYARITQQLRDMVQILLPQRAEDFYALRKSLFSQSQFSDFYRDAIIERSVYLAAGQVETELDIWEREVSKWGWPKVEKDLIAQYDIAPTLTGRELAKEVSMKMQVKHYVDIEKTIEKGYPLFERFCESAQLCQYALWQNALMTTDSGLYQPRKRQQIIVRPEKTLIHPQRTYADMLKQVSSELTNLDNFTARVRYKNAGESLVEATIRTLDPKQPPEKPLFGQAWQERIARIQAQNRTPDERGISHCRPRQEVEAEIKQRQEQCSEPPEEKEQPISRRPPR